MSGAPSALRSITSSYDRNGHRYADVSVGYDMVLVVKERGDNYTALMTSLQKEQYPNPSKDGVVCNRVWLTPEPCYKLCSEGCFIASLYV
jgi:hypothetical protein